MIELRPATPDEATTWAAGWERRLRAWCEAQGYTAAEVIAHLSWVADHRAGAAESTVVAIVDSGANETAGNEGHERHEGPDAGGRVGFCALSEHDQPGGLGRTATIDDLWIDPDHRRRGFGRAALAAVERRCRDRRIARVDVTVEPADPAHVGLFAAYTITSQRMARTVTEPTPLPEGVVGRPMTEIEFVTWQEDAIEGYAADIAGSGVLSAEAAMSRSRREFAELLPNGLHTPDHTLWTLEANGAPVGTIWLKQHRREGASFVLSVSVDADQRGKGYGRAAMRLGERLTLAAGDTVLGLNVFGQNTTAINLYTSLGYTVTDQSRARDLTTPTEGAD